MKTLIPTFSACVCLAAHSSAVPLVYEGFNGYANGSLNGQTAVNTTGLQAAVITNGGNTPTANQFNPTGLTFSNLVVSGGSGRFNAANTGTNNAQTYIGYTYTGPTVTGTLYTSYLVKIEAPQSTGSIVSLRTNLNSTSGSGTSYFVTMADSPATTGTGVQYDASSGTTSSARKLEVGTTYLVIGRFTNVGNTLSAGTPGKGTTFILTDAQFEFFQAEGFADAELDAALIGDGPDQVFARISDADVVSSTHPNYPSGFNRLQSGAGIQFATGNAGAGNPQTATYDEVRYALSLADVIPTGPEPEPVPVSLTVTDPIADEPTATVPSIGRITLTRDDNSTRALTVRLSLTGTATPYSDYYLPTVAFIPANTQSITLEVRPRADQIVEPDETVTVSLLPGFGYLPSSENTAAVTIKDGPPAAYPTQLLNNLSGGKPQHIVVYGTSLTAGNVWPVQMKAALDASFPGLVTLTNSGGSGQNSRWAVDNLESKVIALAPDTVIIEFAVNDAVYRESYTQRVTPREAQDNLLSMIQSIRAAHPECEIILQVMNPVINSPNAPAAATDRPNLALCQQIYRDIGAAKGLLVIDHMPAWQSLLDQGTSAYLAANAVPDGLHPSATGLQNYCTPTLLRELGVTAHVSAGKVMLHANNHRAAEPRASSGAPRPTKITLTRGGPTTDPLEVSLSIGGSAINGTDYTSLPLAATIPAGASSVAIEVEPVSDTLAEGEETVTIALNTAAGYTLASPSKASFLIEDRPFDSWRKSSFTASELLDPQISGDNADPDGDGIPNLIEFFTNRLPNLTDQAPAAISSFESMNGSDFQTLTYTRAIASGLTGIPQISSDLSEWHNGPGFIQETILRDNGLLQTIKARSLMPMDSGKGFMRLKITREP
jgi:acyl-CoA thioesterase-1